MAKRIGIQLSQDGDLNITSGAMQVGDTLQQNQYLLLVAQKGEIKHAPTMGVGIADMVNDEDTLAWKRTIREEFAKDGLQVSELSITSNSMKLKADYK